MANAQWDRSGGLRGSSEETWDLQSAACACGGQRTAAQKLSHLQVENFGRAKTYDMRINASQTVVEADNGGHGTANVVASKTSL